MGCSYSRRRATVPRTLRETVTSLITNAMPHSIIRPIADIVLAYAIDPSDLCVRTLCHFRRINQTMTYMGPILEVFPISSELYVSIAGRDHSRRVFRFHGSTYVVSDELAQLASAIEEIRFRDEYGVECPCIMTATVKIIAQIVCAEYVRAEQKLIAKIEQSR
jgi:hypothetical protein